VTYLIKTKESFRVDKLPLEALPIGARSVGGYIIGDKWRGRETVVRDVIQLHWILEGTMEVCIDDKIHLLSPGHVFFYFPGDIHKVRAQSNTAEYRWLTVDGSLPIEIIKSFDFPREPLFAGECPLELFTQLVREIQDVSPYGRRKAAATVYLIFSLAKGIPQTKANTEQLINSALDIISSKHSDPALNVNMIAETLNVHRSRLSRLFHEKMQVSLIDYIISLRINKAASLLRSSNLSISEIAKQTGYKDPDYFTKAFRKSTGKSPGEFRIKNP
jgi:AraC-like DNA-binding protein